MAKFKVGDTVKLIKSTCEIEIGTQFNVVERCDDRSVWICKDTKQVQERYINSFYYDLFTISFDLTKEKWFIYTPTAEIFEAVQLWLFEQGIGWQYPVGEKIVDRSYKSKIIMSSAYHKGCFCHTNSIDPKQGDHKEIRLKFKTTVDSVIYPEVTSIETEVQKQMKSLEDQIQKLIEQRDSLKQTIDKEGK